MKLSVNKLKLTGVSSCVPSNKVAISDFYNIFGKNEVDRIALSTGIKTLRIAHSNINTSDLCISSSLRLIQELQIDTHDIDAIIFVSQTPDFIMPATSCILQDKLGLKKTALAFDINYGCSGYIYGLLQAALLINAMCCCKVLLCVGDTISKHLDPNDHKSRLVFGDGGSASIIERGDDTWTFDIRTDGSGYKDLMILRNGYLNMNGSAIMEFALREVKNIVDSVVMAQEKTLDAMSAVLLHQANLFMLQYLRKKLHIRKESLPIEVDQYGNTGSASIPITMCAHYFAQNHRLNDAVLAGFGVGLSWGAVLLNLSSTRFTKVYEL